MPPNTVKEIEQAIGRLTPDQRAELLSWIDSHHSESIDARLESDLASGKLDRAMAEALGEEETGPLRPLS